MTPKHRSHIRKGWDISKALAIPGMVLLLMQQSVDLRIKWQASQAQSQTTASSVAGVMKDIGKIMAKDKAQDDRLSRLERSPRQTFVTQRAAAAADTVARSPGFVKAASSLIAAPFRFLGAVFGGG